MSDYITGADAGRPKTGALASVALTNGAVVPFVPYSPTRTSLIIIACSSTLCYADFRKDAVAGASPAFAASGAALSMTERDHGELVKGPWTATTAAAGQFLAYAETLAGS